MEVSSRRIFFKGGRKRPLALFYHTAIIYPDYGIVKAKMTIYLRKVSKVFKEQSLSHLRFQSHIRISMNVQVIC